MAGYSLWRVVFQTNIAEHRNVYPNWVFIGFEKRMEEYSGGIGNIVNHRTDTAHEQERFI